MTDTDRQRLAAILGMLGSEHAGERAAAALQAERVRETFGLSWGDLFSTSIVYVDRPPIVIRPKFSIWGSILIWFACISGAMFTVDIGLHQFGMSLADPPCLAKDHF